MTRLKYVQKSNWPNFIADFTSDVPADKKDDVEMACERAHTICEEQELLAGVVLPVIKSLILHFGPLVGDTIRNNVAEVIKKIVQHPCYDELVSYEKKMNSLRSNSKFVDSPAQLMAIIVQDIRNTL